MHKSSALLSFFILSIFIVSTHAQEPVTFQVEVNPGSSGASLAGGLSATLNTTVNGEVIPVPSFYEISQGENADSIAQGLMKAFLEYLGMNSVECVGEVTTSSAGGSIVKITCFNATAIFISFNPSTLAAANGITVVSTVPNTPTPTPTVCPPGTESTLLINVTSEGARETAVVGLNIQAFPISGNVVNVSVNHTVNTGDSTADLANGLRNSISQALSNAGLDCTVLVRTTQFENVLQVEVTCRCVVDLKGEFTTPETASGTGISIVNDPTPTSTPSYTYTPTHTPTSTHTPTNTNTPTNTPTNTNTHTPTETLTPIIPTNTNTPTPRIFGEEIFDDSFTLDIHPIQVVQDPRDETIQEDIDLIKNKATMVRVFLVWSPPDPTTILNVECTLLIDGTIHRQFGDIYFQGGQTYILPRGDTFFRAPLPFQARDAFNFTFPLTNGHDPSGNIMETIASLRIDGRTIAVSSEDFDLRNFTDKSNNNDSRMEISFRTVESLQKKIRSSRTELVDFAHKQFNRMVAVYPVPHTQARYFLTSSPLQLAGGLNSIALWLLTMSLDRPGLQHIDRFVYITAGETPRTRTTPAQNSLLEDFQGSGTEGFRQNDTLLLVDENAPTFTTAHENGHTLRLGPSYLLGFGHNDVPSGDGWDVRNITGRARPYKPDQSLNALMFSTANDDNDGWISDDEYKELIEKMTSAGSSGKVVHPRQVTISQVDDSILFISGIVKENSADLNPFFTSTGKADLPLDTSDYAALAIAADGSVINEHKFLVQIPPGTDPNGVLVDPDAPDIESDSFGFYMPFPANTDSI